MNDIAKLAIDAHRGCVEGKFSASSVDKTIREALIEANGGRDYLDVRDIRDGNCGAFFSVIEEVIEETVVSAIDSDPLFMEMVEYRNLALGDTNEFVIEDKDLFAVSEIADGTQAIRRQRLLDGETVRVQTTRRGIKVYEELSRLLAGRASMTKLIERIDQSFREKVFMDIATVWNAALSNAKWAKQETGSYSENTMLDLIQYIEAKNGKRAVITGVDSALRKVKAASTDGSELVMNHLFNIGVSGKFYGTPMIRTRQAFKTGTEEYLYSDNTVEVLPLGEKPIKFVTEGKALILPGNPMTQNDLAQEFLLINNYGIAFISSEKRGRYVMT